VLSELVIQSLSVSDSQRGTDASLALTRGLLRPRHTESSNSDSEQLGVRNVMPDKDMLPRVGAALLQTPSHESPTADFVLLRILVSRAVPCYTASDTDHVGN
jgi:hypothetical protein